MRLAADWTIGMIRDQPKAGSFPGGQYYEQIKAEGTIVTLTGA